MLPDPNDFSPLDADAASRWSRFGKWDREYFPTLVGLEVEEIRIDYCRMRLPFRPALEQPMGIVHGGAIATLLDAVVVPAIGSAYSVGTGYSTVDLNIQFHSSLKAEDAVAHGWVVKRGRRIVFCEATAIGATTGRVIAKAALTYAISDPPTP
jgi:uncharacterized protein (TIGR00369 family)